MVLLSGGVDGGTTSHVAELAEIIEAANPKPRLGVTYELPVIYAGNKDASEIVGDRLGDKMALEVVDNLRPVLERENLMPTRLKIQDQFPRACDGARPRLQEVNLLDRCANYADARRCRCNYANNRRTAEHPSSWRGHGGATTDVFSVFKNQEGEAIFNRTVSANLGMSYSISNVLAEAGMENVCGGCPLILMSAILGIESKTK